MKGLPRVLARGPKGRQDVVKDVVRLNALPIRVAGATGIGFGTAIIAGLPQGNILFLGAIAYLQFTKLSTASGITTSFDGDFSIGSAPTADLTLSGAEIDIVPSTALGAATAGVSPVVRGANATQVMLDNTDGSLELNLNLLIDDAAISAIDQDLTVTGVVHVLYSVLGDD